MLAVESPMKTKKLISEQVQAKRGHLSMNKNSNVVSGVHNLQEMD